MKGPSMIRMRSTRLPIAALLIVLAVAGCGGSEKPAETPDSPSPQPSAPSAPSAPADQAAVKHAPAAPQEKFDVDFVEAKPAPDLERSPRVSINVPGYDQPISPKLVANTRVIYSVQGLSDAPEGSYLQFVLDNKPFRPITNMSEKIMLTDLAGPDGLAEGEHFVAAFINRPNHESIKDDKNVAVRRFFVGGMTNPRWNSRNGPLLILGSPHQTVNGDPLVDYIVLNATISSTQYSIRAFVEGPGMKPNGSTQRIITIARPWIILSAREDVEYKVELQLLDSQGEPVPYGSATRTFKVQRD